MVTSRCRLDLLSEDVDGNAIQNALFFVLADASAAGVTGTPTGTAVNVYNAKTGGALLQTAGGGIASIGPSGTTGQIAVWVDDPGQYDVVMTSNSSTAYYPAFPTQLLAFNNVFRTQHAHPVTRGRYFSINQLPTEVWVSRVAGSDSYDADYIGRWDYPYATDAAALAGLPAGDNGARSGVIKHRVGPRFDASQSFASWPSTAEYQSYNSQLSLALTTGIIYDGGNVGNDKSGSPYGAASTRINFCIRPSNSFPNDGTPVMAMFSQTNAILRNTCIVGNASVPNAVGARVGDGPGASPLAGQATIIDNCLFTSLNKGLEYWGYKNDHSRVTDSQFVLNTKYGIYCVGGTNTDVSSTGGSTFVQQASNNIDIGNCFLYWNGDITGNAATPVGGNVFLEGGTSPSSAAMITMHHNNFFGYAIPVNIAGYHMVDIHHNQFEVAANDSTGALNPKDRPYVKVRKNPSGAGGDNYAANISVHRNYIHQNPITINDDGAGPHVAWTANVGVYFDVDECIAFTAEKNDYLASDYTRFTAANPLCYLGANAFASEIHHRPVFDGNTGRGTRAVNGTVTLPMINNNSSGGNGNWGTYWLDTTPAYKFWGTPPS